MAQQKSPQKKPTTPKRFKQAQEIRKSKVAMLSARKNVQKAKKLLIARKQPQLMVISLNQRFLSEFQSSLLFQFKTQRYASKLGLATKNHNQKVKQIKYNNPQITQL